MNVALTAILLKSLNKKDFIIKDNEIKDLKSDKQVIGIRIAKQSSGVTIIEGNSIKRLKSLNGEMIGISTNYNDVLIKNNIVDCEGSPVTTSFVVSQGIFIDVNLNPPTTPYSITLEGNKLINCGTGIWVS